MLALGIAASRSGWAVALWDEERAARLSAMASTEALWPMLRELEEAHPLLPIVLPSGGGVPVTRAGELLDQDIAEMLGGLPTEMTERLGPCLVEARRRIPRAFCIPGVRLLPTVPLHRKLGRADLGSAEALCAGIWALHCLRQTGGANVAENLLLVLRGRAGRTLLVVQEGRIVDGVGEGQPGLHPTDGAGPMRGRQASFRARDPLTLREAENRLPGCDRLAQSEALCKEALGLAAAYRLSDVVLIGSHPAETASTLASRLVRHPLPEVAEGYEAALGGALVAAGLTGGSSAPLVNRLAIREARERAADWLEP
jgi:predicted butyrate kinase (DUF1464 family)